MSDPLYLERDGHRTSIKWHRGRRKPIDPVFTGSRILEAMRLGASVEVDLVIHADHGCAILHNFALDAETTGTGLVRETPASVLRELNLRGNDGQPIADKVMLLEDLCALLSKEKPHPDALLQLDFKEGHAALTPSIVANFGASVAPVADYLILSGGDFDAIGMLTNSAPKLRSGYDPCYGESLAKLQATGDYQTFISEALATAPDADMIYLAYEIVLAADKSGFDIVAPIHAAGKRIDAWTIRQVDSSTIPLIERLLALKVDQITTDDPEGLAAAFAS
ncbi:glycerophosphodiester phosphodiesterase family protein [Devosia sp. Leaf64]|uniref:glycerophosphodiester phosphodiesterase n=1 Tax=Devosia sp. Leaf64 TaxID=1736229 RepID=UPI000712AD48|nr:glycerophosphodiester phosphodiesterase family protein [Devosia sp. Leaf64]KQN78294.1 glycerophosphodiester phosphodiesterase [Devosia sp. Leaf64]